MIYETEHFILDCNKGHFINNKAEFDCDINDGLIIYKKYTDSNTKVCDIVYNKISNSCNTLFVDNSLVDNIVNWPDYQEFAKVLDEAVYRVELANKLAEFNNNLN